MVRVIREAILEAHLNAKKWNQTVYVVNDDFLSTVTESYFIDEKGNIKNKPFREIYNTKDCEYGCHKVIFENNDISFILNENYL